NGSLWWAQAVAGDSGYPKIRWFELDTSTLQLKQVGEFAGLGRAFCPGMFVQNSGEVYFVFVTVSDTEYASAGYAHHAPTDPAGVISEVSVYQKGVAPSPSSRWGDYVGMSGDPTDGSVWGISLAVSQDR